MLVDLGISSTLSTGSCAAEVHCSGGFDRDGNARKLSQALVEQVAPGTWCPRGLPRCWRLERLDKQQGHDAGGNRQPAYACDNKGR